ncbi:MAG: hypothetical protein JNL52_05955 [Flavobacteriales bacterium]|nr:hypothetical protein [Flavobacteriales bacterium]
MSDLTYIRRWLLVFMLGLLVSGLTAVPLVWLTSVFAELVEPVGGPLYEWAEKAADAVALVDANYPLLFYGTDWLAFAHVVIAMAFIGPFRDPVRNKWVVEWGLLCCACVLLLAFLWAPVRGIPFFWRCVDASFGVVGAIPLWTVLRRIRRMERRYDINVVSTHFGQFSDRQ